MDKLTEIFDQIEKYKQNISYIRSSLDQIQNKKYFNTDKLIDDINTDRQEIQGFFNSLQQNRMYLELKQQILKSKFSQHPSRKPIQIKIRPQMIPSNQGRKQKLYRQLIIQNCRIQLTVNPLRMHPISKSTGRFHSRNIPACNFRFIMYHTDKISQIGPLGYNQSFNLRRSHSYANSASNEVNRNKKLGNLRIIYEITLRNYQIVKQLFCKQPDVHIYLENQYKMIVAVCRLDLLQFISSSETKTDCKDSQQIRPSKINNDFCVKKHKLLRFYTLAQKQQMKQQVFELQCQITFNKLLISPQIFELRQKMHSKKILLTTPTRSRSPSPTLHRYTAKKLINSINREITPKKIYDGQSNEIVNMNRQQTKQKFVKRLLIISNRLFKTQIHHKQTKYEKMDLKLSIVQTQNILNGYTLQIQENLDSFILNILIKLKNQLEQGFIQFNVGEKVFKIAIKPNRLFKILTLTQSKSIFKVQQDYEKHSNTLISLTQNVYIRPNVIIRIIQYPIQQKIMRYDIASYFFKCSTVLFEDYYLYPGNVRDVIKLQEEHGTKIQFTLNNEWLKQVRELKVVFAGKSLYKGGDKAANKEIKPQMKKNTPQPRVTQISKHSQKGDLTKSKGNKLLSKTAIDNSTQNCSQSYIQLHIVKYVILEPKPQVTLSLMVRQPEVYSIDLTGMLFRNSKYQLISCDEQKVCVCKHIFEQQSNLERSQIQLMKRININQTVLMVLRDLTRHHATAFNLNLIQNTNLGTNKKFRLPSK